ncbi:endonuclease domain-containing protein [Sphingomonas sp.]|uniref:endonuclease domain-containing protein n=1 Tax=Sphingomonas sp. TaxID=28214 RepID=UPI003CC57659
MRRHPTDAERRLWSMLRDRRLGAYKFRRQVSLVPYIVDFVCFEHRTIVEADGTQHFASDYDIRRDTWLRRQRFETLRFWNSDILARPRRVGEALLLALATPHPPTASRRAPPSPARGEGFGALDA